MAVSYSNRIVLGLASTFSAVSLLMADTQTDYTCEPIAAPVTGCECPEGANTPNYCEGALPKGGCMYGDVMCMMMAGFDCITSTSGANSCGGVVNVVGGPNCGTAPWNFCDENGEPLEQVPKPGKPPCTNTWGECEYSS